MQEKKCADGETRWVVMGRFPPGQIGGAKMWCYPPDSEASAAMFSPMGGESPAASPTLNTPLHSKVGRRLASDSCLLLSRNSKIVRLSDLSSCQCCDLRVFSSVL